MTKDPVAGQTNIETPDRQELVPTELTHKDVIKRTPTAVVHQVSTSNSHDIAIKHPPLHGTLNTEIVDSFRNEAQRWSQLATHDNIVEVVDWDATPLPWLHHDIELPWIAMEYMDGGELTEYAGELSVEASLWVAERLADAVWHAHHHGGGVIHHDLKPANILFQSTPDGRWPLPKISDWELARTLLNHSDSIGVTTPQYIAPEQARNAETNQWTDQFQLGIVLYELFTGTHPFISNPQSAPEATRITAILENSPTQASEVRSDLPSEIDSILRTMLAKKSSDRYEAMLTVRKRIVTIRKAYDSDSQSTTEISDVISSDEKFETTGKESSQTDSNTNTDAEPPQESPALSQLINAQHWRMFGGGPARTSSQSTMGPTSLQTQWEFQTNDEVFSSPTVGVDTIYVGSKDNYVYAINRDDGSEKWRVATRDAVFSSPATDGSTVYVGSNDGNVYAIDSADGSEDWSFKTNGRIRSSPAVTQGTVYFGSADNTVYAIDAINGTEQWSYQTFGKIDSSPAVVDGTLYIGCKQGYVYALDIDDGSRRWRPFETENGIFSSPVVVDDTIYIGSRDGQVYAIGCDDGAKRWSFETNNWIESSPAIIGDTVYFGGRNGIVYARDAVDGSSRWEFDTEGQIFASPAVGDNNVYITGYPEKKYGKYWDNSYGHVYAINATDGTKIAHRGLENRILSSPAIGGGTLYIGSHDGSIYALS